MEIYGSLTTFSCLGISSTFHFSFSSVQLSPAVSPNCKYPLFDLGTELTITTLKKNHKPMLKSIRRRFHMTICCSKFGALNINFLMVKVTTDAALATRHILTAAVVRHVCLLLLLLLLSRFDW